MGQETDLTLLISEQKLTSILRKEEKEKWNIVIYCRTNNISFFLFFFFQRQKPMKMSTE
jgi:hypothetical protein